MNAEQVMGIVRAVVAAVGGWAVGQGWLDNETAVTVGGAVTTIVVAAWSVWAKREAE